MGDSMSSIVIAGDASGTVTVAVPAVAGTNTVTIAAQTGTLNAAGPAFSAYLASNQSISNGTYTKVTFDTEEFDTNNNFASSRFTPTVAGYYQINGGISAGTSVITAAVVKIYKNGSAYKAGTAIGGTTFTFFGLSVSSIIYLNGSTDYVELYGYVTATTPIFTGGQDQTWFNGSLVRGA